MCSAQNMGVRHRERPVWDRAASASAVIDDVIGDLIFQACRNARGGLWEARGSIAYQCSLVYG
jgi:hypothetical protein